MRKRCPTCVKLPHEKLGLSELAYNLAFGQGYRGDKCGYKKGTALHKAFQAGKRATKRGV